MSYNRVPDQILYPLIMRSGPSALERAWRHYKEMKGLDFLTDLFDYMANGFVVVRPNMLAMAKPIEHEGRRGWFIRYALGELWEIAAVLPCQLEFLAWCRNNDGVLRFVDTKTFLRLARKQRGNKWVAEEQAAVARISP